MGPAALHPLRRMWCKHLLILGDGLFTHNTQDSAFTHHISHKQTIMNPQHRCIVLCTKNKHKGKVQVYTSHTVNTKKKNELEHAPSTCMSLCVVKKTETQRCTKYKTETQMYTQRTNEKGDDRLMFDFSSVKSRV